MSKTTQYIFVCDVCGARKTSETSGDNPDGWGSVSVYLPLPTVRDPATSNRHYGKQTCADSQLWCASCIEPFAKRLHPEHWEFPVPPATPQLAPAKTRDEALLDLLRGFIREEAQQ